MRGLLLGLAFAWAATLWPGAGRAAPIVLEYEITEGTTTGDVLEGQDILSGSLTLTFPSWAPASGSVIFFTNLGNHVEFSFSVDLTGTGGATFATRIPSNVCCYQSAGGQMLVGYYYTLGGAFASRNRFYSFSGTLFRSYRRIAIVNGTANQSQLGLQLTTTDYRRFGPEGTFGISATSGSASFVGQEISVPEPRSAHLLAFSFVGAVLAWALSRLGWWRPLLAPRGTPASSAPAFSRR